MDLLKDLNEEQRHAVELIDGPVLVLAGAGSGKTRVLVHRVAHALATGRAAPDEVVAVTFTNKAADEMKERVGRLIGTVGSPSRVGTFHSLCLRMLRREAPRLGYRDGFQIFDTDDSLRLVRDCLKESGSEEGAASAREVLRRISSAKNRGTAPEEAEKEWRGPGGPLQAAAYAAYQAALRRMNAMDFDDLILNVLRLFEEHPQRRELWAGTCRYLLVDEYQDTNPPQYRLVRDLSAVHGNVCVVGDEDQAIYRFRGADIGNILSFQQDFPGAKVVKLTRNYRSTGAILEAANALVRRNRRRIGKDLWTKAGRGEAVRLTILPGDREEAAFVLQAIQEWGRSGPLEEAAVLYRTNAQSRLFEEALVRAGLPYRIYGSVRFYDRKEVRDLVAYLRLAVNRSDDVSLRRVINLPPRGIGEAAMIAVENAARSGGGSLFGGLEAALAAGSFPARAAASAAGFVRLVEGLGEKVATMPASDLVQDLIREIDYEGYLRRSDPDEADARLENVAQLVAAAAEAAESGGLQEFLDRASLVSETESVQGDRGVNLMTLHSAKGLEFDVVFLVGMEEGLLPHARSLEGDEDLEEERRLAYVGMTRARRRLHLTAAGARLAYGELQRSTLSRFLEEIGEENLSREGYGAPRRGGSRGRGWSVREEIPFGEEDVSAHPEEDDGIFFRLGARVRHDQFGTGEVVGVELAVQGQKVTVRFDRGGLRKLLTRYARLVAVR